MNIPFNKPYLTGNETTNIIQAAENGRLSGNGFFTEQCQLFFESKYGFKKTLLTSSCTDALEMAAILLDIKLGDEVIMPSFTFVSMANAFVMRGAKVIFCDSSPESPNVDVSLIEPLITERTKAIVVLHYAGIAVDMDIVMSLADKYQLFVVEDAAHSHDSYHYDKALGSIGHLATFSFHETKNIISGEGGMLVINEEAFFKRSEIIWEKGTNKVDYLRGKVSKYSWVDIGSSFLASEVTAAFLLAQLESLTKIQIKRKEIWQSYFNKLQQLEQRSFFKFLHRPIYSTINSHMFALICKNQNERDSLMEYLNKKGINAIFHYLPLHSSPYYKEQQGDRELPNATFFSDCILRLPLFYELKEESIQYTCDEIATFFELHALEFQSLKNASL